MHLRTLFVVAAALVCAACNGKSDNMASASIVVDSVPFLSIGVEEGETPYEFDRVFDAYRHSDGRVVVSNAGSHELRIFDSTGKYLGALGRRGQGPMEFGEFSSQYLYARNNELIAVDEGAFRVHVINNDLTFRETRRFTLYPDTPRPFFRGLASNGDWLVQAFTNGGSITGEPGQVLPASYQLLRYDSLGAMRDTILSLPSRPRYVNSHNGMVHFPYIPLSSEPSFVVDGERLIVVSGRAPALEIYSLDGESIAQYAWNRPQVRTADVWEEFKRSSLANMKGDDSARYAAFYEKALPLPETAPMYVSVKVDGLGRIWLERFRMPTETVRTWDVLSAEGELLGATTTPAGVTVLRIANDIMVGRARDSLGVERVQLYRVR